MSPLGLALALLPLWLYPLATLVAAARFARRRTVPSPAPRPVTVLKPLYGAEPGLRDNLRSFVAQDYPAAQIVMGVRNPADPAVATARALIAEFPGRDIALVVDPAARGRNLKVANLENTLPAGRHDVLVIADSDMRVAPRRPAHQLRVFARRPPRRGARRRRRLLRRDDRAAPRGARPHRRLRPAARRTGRRPPHRRRGARGGARRDLVALSCRDLRQRS